jgi:hypothetical protein
LPLAAAIHADQAAERAGDAADMLQTGPADLHRPAGQTGNPDSGTGGDLRPGNLERRERGTDLQADHPQAFIGEEQVAGGTDHHMPQRLRMQPAAQARQLVDVSRAHDHRCPPADAPAADARQGNVERHRAGTHPFEVADR